MPKGGHGVSQSVIQLYLSHQYIAKVPRPLSWEVKPLTSLRGFALFAPDGAHAPDVPPGTEFEKPPGFEGRRPLGSEFEHRRVRSPVPGCCQLLFAPGGARARLRSHFAASHDPHRCRVAKNSEVLGRGWARASGLVRKKIPPSSMSRSSGGTTLAMRA